MLPRALGSIRLAPRHPLVVSEARPNIFASQTRLLATKKKKQKKTLTKVRDVETFGPKYAIESIKELSTAKFDESFDISLHLGLDPRKPNQAIRTTIPLPHGTGKSCKVCAFVPDELVDEAKKAGADIIGTEELIADIEKGGNISFDRCFAHPDYQHLFRKVARKLGPRGLLPTAKLGTLTKDIIPAIEGAKKGPVSVRTDRAGRILGSIGRLSYTNEMLEENLKTFLIGIADHKPEGAKGTFMLSCTVSSTMGKKAIPLHIKACDPGSNYFMLEDVDVK